MYSLLARWMPTLFGPDYCRQTLDAAVERQVSALVVSTQTGRTVVGQLARVSPDRVEVCVSTASMALDTARSGECVVLFTLDGEHHAFTSTIQATVARHDGDTILSFGLPQLLVQRPPRVAFRVPVLQQSGLQVTLMSMDNQTWRGAPVDLSFTGTKISFPLGSAPEIGLQTIVQVMIRLDEEKVCLRGRIIRCEQSDEEAGVAIQFPEVQTEDGLRPPKALQRIVKALQSANTSCAA